MTVASAATVATFIGITGSLEAALPALVVTFVLTVLLQMAMGITSIGSLIKFIPYPVISGFMSGIGVIIILLQVPHRKVELHLSASGTVWTVLRPDFFAQNLQDAYRRDILEDRRLYVPAGQRRVAFLDVRHAALVATRIFECPEQFRGQALTLTGPEALSFSDVATALTSALGMPVHYTAAAIMGYFWHLVLRRRMSWMQALVQTVLHVGLRKGDAERVDATVQAMLGRPSGTLASYAARTVATWRT